MDIYHHDRKCPKCLTWTSEVEGCKSMETSTDNPYIDLMECNKCGFVSKWDCSSMLPFLIKD